MKENLSAIEQRLKRAIEETTPNVLPEVLRRIDEERGGTVEMTDMAMPIKEQPVWGEIEKKKRKSNVWAKWAGGIAAVFALVFLFQFGYGQYTPQAVISFDVNPSIELKVNQAERILSITPLNEDGRIVIGEMKLKNVDLDVAVNALVGSMVKHGYISEIKNSILISVDSSNVEKGTQLKERLTQEVNSLLDTYAVHGAVLSQTISEDARIMTLAQEHQISYGKAALVDQLVNQQPTLNFADIASLPINDIHLLIDARKPDLAGVTTNGQASSQGYLGEAKAKAIALTHAGTTESAVSALKIKLDYDDGRMVYEVEFWVNNQEYEYDIDATSGSILKYDVESKSRPNHKDDHSADSTQYIGMENARQVALSHAGATLETVRKLEIKLDKEDGRMIYEIEFVYGNMEYEYEVDAITGKILFWESELD